MHLSHLLPIFAVGLATALPTENAEVDPRAAASVPDGVKIASVAYAGSGCPADDTGPVSSDGKTFNLPHWSLVASSGPGIAFTNVRKNCQLAAKIRYPAGWQFSISQAEYSGSASLPAGVSGSSVATVYFSGETKQSSSHKDIDGPFEGKYTHVAKFTGSDAVWSGCGTESVININADARLTPENLSKAAKITVNTPESVEVQWRRC